MSIFENNLSYEEFLQNEIKTLGFLQGLSSIATNFSNLYGQATVFYNNYKGLLKARTPEQIKFEFQCTLELIIEKERRTVVIESIVMPDFSLSSYVYAICDNRDVNSFVLLRKFHFDYAIPNEYNVSKPVYHLQYAGDKLKSIDADIDPLFPWCSNPRINYTPINLAILLDYIFCEFQEANLAAGTIVERKEWREHIKHNEELILIPYYSRINQFISRDHRFDFLLRDFYYGK